MSKLIIGLTGGIASGKTTVSNTFKLLGVDIIDADIIAREVVTPPSEALHAIADYFGNHYLTVDGQLNRTLLRQKVFSADEHKQWLNNLLHPLIRTCIIEQTAQASSQYCILVAPLLIENNLVSLVDRVLVVDVSKARQIQRTITRDNSHLTEVNAIIASQTSRTQRLKIADDVIDNDNISQLILQETVTALHKKYLNLTKIV
jgi:dephospho-CoA kinase